MRFAYAALAFGFFAAGTTVFLLACSSDTPASPGGTSGTLGTSSSGSSGNQNGDSGGGGGADSGNLYYSPTGCVIHCTEHQKAGKFESLARADKPDGIAWTNPAGAAQEDGDFATVTLQDGQESAYLQVSSFDFSMITDDKSTWGISVELERQAVDGGIVDATIEVTIVGQTPNNKVLDGFWPRVIVGTHHYGQAIDTWGVDLNPKDVRPPGFGARIAAKRQPGVVGPVTGKVDSLRVAVCYCNADKK